MLNIRQHKNGIRIIPVDTLTLDRVGELQVKVSDGKLYYHNGSSSSSIITATSVDVLTNKTIDTGTNTVANLSNANLNGSAAITNANLASMASHTIKGNASGSGSVPSDLTGTQTTALLDPFIGDSGSGGTKGLVPAPAAGDFAANKFLSAGGGYGVPTVGNVIVGTINSQPKSSDGLNAEPGANLVAQTADASFPGMVSTGDQTFAGTKTFSSISASSISASSISAHTISVDSIFINGSSNFTSSKFTVTANGHKTGIIASSAFLISDFNIELPYSLPESEPCLLSITSTGVIQDNFTVSGMRNNLVAVGTILMYGGTTAPDHYLLCDGTSYLHSDYSALYQAIGNAFGAADGSHFNVPDMRGYFPRGVDSGAGNDPDTSSRTALKPGGNTGDNVGSVQSDQFASHTHSLTTSNASGGGQTRAESSDAANGDRTVITNASGGNETRPKNVYFNFIIKA